MVLLNAFDTIKISDAIESCTPSFLMVVINFFQFQTEYLSSFQGNMAVFFNFLTFEKATSVALS